MNLTRATHLLAMDMATLADISKGKGLLTDAKDFYTKAFELEKKAALMTIPTKEDEDAHFILIRSAASLALTAGLYEAGKNLIKTSLHKKPSEWIANELNEILELILTEEKKGLEAKETRQFDGVITNINSNNFEIVLQVKSNESFAIIVPQEIFIEVVKKYWLHRVNIKASKTNQGIFLLNHISAA